MRPSRIFQTLALAGALLLATSIFSISMAAQPLTLTGAGATFPAPLYQRWFRDYFRIFLGEIQRWNDPRIQATTKGVDLPDMPVTLVARSDSSGTSFVMIRHLSAVSEQFARAVGDSMTPVWPKALKKQGALIRAKGNGGVAATVKAVPGSIGYVQYAYADLTDMQMASLENKAGEYVAPNSESFRAAVESFKADLDPRDLADPYGGGSYPILTLSWLITRETLEPEKAQALKDVVRYCLGDSRKTASLLGYIPLTEQAVKQILLRLGLIK